VGMDGTPGVVSFEIRGIVILGMIQKTMCRHTFTRIQGNPKGVGVLSSVGSSGVVKDGMTRTATKDTVSFVKGPLRAQHAPPRRALWASTARRVSRGRQQMLAASLAAMRQNVAGQARVQFTRLLEAPCTATTVDGMPQ